MKVKPGDMRVHVCDAVGPALWLLETPVANATPSAFCLLVTGPYPRALPGPCSRWFRVASFAANKHCGQQTGPSPQPEQSFARFFSNTQVTSSVWPSDDRKC